MNEVVIQIRKKKYTVSIDKSFIDHINALGHDENHIFSINQMKLENWVRTVVLQNSKLETHISNLVNDCLDKNLNGVLYTGSFQIKDFEAPRIKNFLRKSKRSYFKKHKPRKFDIQKIIIPDNLKKEIHPDAELFPFMHEDDFAILVEDIQINGQKETIKLLDGRIIDGRNRYMACIAAHVKPKFQDIEIDDTYKYVVSINTNRRHLDTSQRSWVAAKLYQRSSFADTPLTQQEAADMLNVSRRSLVSAVGVMSRCSDELSDALDAGKVAISAAEKITEFSHQQQKCFLELPKNKRMRYVNGIRSKKKSISTIVPIEFSSDEMKALDKHLLHTSNAEKSEVFRKIILDFYKIKDSNH
jgi:ParB-like chromosome segregation protein Spo0J